MSMNGRHNPSRHCQMSRACEGTGSSHPFKLHTDEIICIFLLMPAECSNQILTW